MSFSNYNFQSPGMIVFKCSFRIAALTNWNLPNCLDDSLPIKTGYILYFVDNYHIFEYFTDHLVFCYSSLNDLPLTFLPVHQIVLRNTLTPEQEIKYPLK